MTEPFSAESRLVHAGTDLITDIDRALEVL